MTYNPGAGSIAIGGAISGSVAGDSLFVDSSGNLGQSTQQLWGSQLTYSPINFFPSGATKQFWLDFGDSASMLNGSSLPCSNGDGIQTAKDELTAVTQFTQSTSGQRPTFLTNQVNSRSAAHFVSASNSNLSGSVLNYLNGKSKLTFATVVNLDDTADKLFFGLLNNAGTNNRFSLFTSSTTLRMWGQSGDGAQQTVACNQVVPASQWHAIVCQFDCLNAATSIWVDSYPTSLSNTSVGSSGTWPNTNSNFVRIGFTASQSNFVMAECFLVTDNFMTDFQRAQWFAAVKSRFALTTY